MARLLGLIEPRVEDRLVPDEGEFIVDEVRHHWVVYVPRVLEVLLAIGLAVLAVFVPLGLAFLPLIAAGVLVLRAGFKALESYVDRFVMTNLRVFRSWGLVSRQLATMPIQRILDIAVAKPLVGRVFDYGHFVFESAAQDQGLREIRFVARPFDRDLTMQRIIQRAGLRRGMPPLPDSDDGDGSELWGGEPDATPPPDPVGRRPAPAIRGGLDGPRRRPAVDRPPLDRPPPDRRPDTGPYRSRVRPRPPVDREPPDDVEPGESESPDR